MAENNVTVAELQENFERSRAHVRREPVMVSDAGRDSVFLLCAADYRDYLELEQNSTPDGGVTEEFQRDLDAFMEEHAGVLAGLAKC